MYLLLLFDREKESLNIGKECLNIGTNVVHFTFDVHTILLVISSENLVMCYFNKREGPPKRIFYRKG